MIPYSKVYQEGICCRVNAQNEGDFTDGYTHNKCVQSASGLPAYSFGFCDPKKPNNVTNIGTLHDNEARPAACCLLLVACRVLLDIEPGRGVRTWQVLTQTWQVLTRTSRCLAGLQS